MPPFIEKLAHVAAGNVVVPFLAGFLVAAAALWICSLPFRRIPVGSHWSVLARKYWPIRRARVMTLLWIAFVAYFSSPEGFHFPVTLSAICGCLAGFRVGRLGLVLPESASTWKWRYLPTRMLLAPSCPLLLLLLALTWNSGIGHNSILTAVLILLVALALHLGGSMAILKYLGVLRPIEGRIQQISQNLATAQGAPLRSVMQMDLGIANAFATPFSHDIIITDTAFKVLDEEELQSVIAHEVGHLKEGRAAGWKRLIGLPSLISLGLAPAAIVSGHPEIALILFAAFIVLSRLVSRHHKIREIAADKVAHLSQGAEGTYARALEKLHIASLVPAILDPRNRYPSLYDRMESAGITPDFPRPLPPNRFISLYVSALAALLFYFLWQGLQTMV